MSAWRESRPTSPSPAARRRGRRFASALLWWGVPAVAAAAVGAYALGIVAWHANPPLVPVAGVSMRPTLQPGDLVLLEGVAPAELHKGEIVAVRVPADARSKYGLPGSIVHRIVHVERTAEGVVVVTRGDANPGNDVFSTPAADVIGREVADLRGLGYPLLFFRSTQGHVFLGAVVLVGVLYFLLGVFEERRAYSEGTARAFELVLAETSSLREALSPREPAVPVAPPAAAPPDETIRELVGAVAEYGEHLRSHTEVMRNLAATTRELREATVEMRGALALGAAVPTPPPRPPLLERTRRGYSRRSVEALVADLAERLEETEARLRDAEQRRAELEARLADPAQTLALTRRSIEEFRQHADEEISRALDEVESVRARHELALEEARRQGTEGLGEDAYLSR